MFVSLVLVLSSALISGLMAEERVATNQPKFVSRGSELYVKEGQTVELECEVSDLGEFVLLWKFNRTTVLFAGNLRIHRDDRISRNDSYGALTITDFSQENAGEYSCQVSTNPPQDILYQVHLLGPPLIQGESTAEVIVKKFDPVELKCETNAEHMEWRKDSLKLLNTKNILRIERVDKEDAGSYSCIASNDMGQSSRTIQLRVLYSPQVTVSASVVHAPIGQPVIIQCLVSSEPSANVNWFRNPNAKVLPSDNLMIDRNETTATLKIHQVTLDDYDNYTCVANNSLGSAVQSVLITGKPSTPVFVSDPLVGRQKSYLLKWILDSEEPITEYVIKWRARDSQEWQESRVKPEEEEEEKKVKKEFSFEMTSLEEDQNYEAVVHVHNKYGATISDVFAFVTSWANHVTRPSLWAFGSLFLLFFCSVNSFK